MDDRPSENYTIMILPNPTSKAVRFSVTKKQVKIGVACAAAAAVLLVVFVVQYLYMVGNIWELTVLRKETAFQKSKIEFFSQSVDGLKTQLDRLKEFDVKLRMITDLNVPADADRYLGVGGVDGPDVIAPDATLISNPPQPQGGTGGADEPLDPAVHIAPHQDLAATMIPAMEEDLATLQVLASKQEQSFRELTEAIEHRRAKWASTPSIWPVRGWVTSGYGPRQSPFTGAPTMHRGVDISVAEGTPLVASANGYVRFTGWNGGFGNAVKIDHGHGYQTLYGHLSKILVRSGQRVRRGDTIGLVGSTGLSTGPHLHYQVSVNNSPVNPLRYILN